MFIFALLVVAGVGVYVMTPDERARLVRPVAGLLRQTLGIAGAWRGRAEDPFSAELRARVRWPFVTAVLASASVAVLALGLGSAGALDDPATLVAWGGNFGPRTTDGERWRVFTSIFVHRGVFHLLVNVVALIQVGIILERVAGPFTFGTVFLAAGALSSIVNGAAFPMTVVVGSTGAVFGLYGLLLATAVRGFLRETDLRIPATVWARMAPVAVGFVLYHVATGDGQAARIGLSAGVVSGIVLTRRIGDYRARLQRFAALGAATAAIVLLAAMSVRAVTDVRPEIARVAENEQRTAGAYDTAVLQFRKGRVTAPELAQVIDDAIAPSLVRARERLRAIVNVPATDAALVAETEEFLRLREESWRVRASALRNASIPGLRDADTIERSALQIFERIRPAVSN